MDSHFSSINKAYERWTYGEGWIAGRQVGRAQGFDEGYAAGFDTGSEVGAERILLGLKQALYDRVGDSVAELLVNLPRIGEYTDYRRRTAWTNEPCAEVCGKCSRCIRALAVQLNREQYGSADYPGLEREKEVGHDGS